MINYGIRILLLCFIIIGSLSTSIARADDLRISCDLRILELNETQRNQIRIRRQAYKREQNNIRRQLQNQANQQSLQHFFASAAFDTQQAGLIAKQRYEVDMRQAVAELNFYHDIFQLLNEKQKRIWLEQCVSANGKHT